MPSGPGERFDFFLSRRGSVAAIAQEVEHVLAEKGYRILTQDYDIPLGSNFTEKMHAEATPGDGADRAQAAPRDADRLKADVNSLAK